MPEKLLEIDLKCYSYKELDKDFLKEKALFFKNMCLRFIENDIHVKNEFESRKELINRCINGEVDNFVKSIGQTYEEYEKLLPKDVGQAWAEFILYLTNCITKSSDEFIVKNNRYYISVKSSDWRGDG